MFIGFSMKHLLQSIQQYKLFFILYLICLLWCFNVFYLQMQFEKNVAHIGEGERVARGEGMIYNQLLTFFIGAGTAIVMLLNAFFLIKERRTVYLIASVLIIFPILILLIVCL